MSIYKTKKFVKWQLANNITDSTLMHILQVYHPLNAINQYLLLYVLIGPFIPFRSLVFRCQMPELQSHMKATGGPSLEW